MSSVVQLTKFFKVKLFRGFIGLPEKHREWAKNLGLRKRGETVYVPVRAETVGSILKLKELLKVDLVDEIPKAINPTYPKGYQIVSSYLNNGKQLH
jgi:ribosomal protein L30